ncbi:MAG: AmmeMemoRadiSam system radical SAM enzyme [Deltaproteobacteria bacterium]|nr:AmmeMemoRadiSam system radical SAM enzyme [Deltaproteobacteria bacterium]
MFYEPCEGQAVQCGLCGHCCRIGPGERGVCQVRENRDGKLCALAYGLLLAMTPDPIEKKPLAHFQPGTRSLSIASAGCNLSCPWCQNYHLSDVVRRSGEICGDFLPPEQVVAEAVARRCASISYTYSEPTIHYEHNRATGVLARRQGLKNVFVTNGLMTVEAARDAARSFLDAANVDLKAMREETYKKLCKGPLASVLGCIRTLWEHGVWVEVTTLVIPGLNDSDEELRDTARFLLSVSPDLPWHLSRYHPDHRYDDAPPTPVETLQRARSTGLAAGLRHVYTGNVWGDEGEHTYCPSCGAIAIRRRGYQAAATGMRGGKCTSCGAGIAGVQMP